MTPAVQEMAAASFVRDLEASCRFYELLGFGEHPAGSASAPAWSALRQGGYLVLLARTRPTLDIPRLPLLFYFYFDDLDAAIERVRAGGIEVLHQGYPAHALGGEAKVLDPDGNTVLLGQRERSAGRAHQAGPDAAPRSRPPQAPAMPTAGGEPAGGCQVLDIDGRPCGQQAGLRLADSAGDSLWACLDHADEILVTVRGAFIASEMADGISGFRSRRR